MLGIAMVSETMPLRKAGISAPILVYDYVPLWQMREAVRQDLTITFHYEVASEILARVLRVDNYFLPF